MPIPASRIAPHPGMVLAVHTAGMFAEGIRMGSVLIDETSAQNHILVLHHQDTVTGRWWGIEGRPGGVGWRDASDYLSNVATVSNQHQPLDTGQQALVCSTMQQTLGTPYDWDAIMQDAARDLHLPETWAGTHENWNNVRGSVPAHVVCSSVAAWAYRQASAEYPRQVDLRHTQPADWVQFILANNYA